MNNNRLNVLIIDDSEDYSLALVSKLKNAFSEVTHKKISSALSLRDSLNENNWDIIISDYQLSQFSALEALRILKETERDLPFIVVTDSQGEEKAVDLIRLGANDYIIKEKNISRLLPSVKREMKEAQARKQKRYADHQLRKTMNELQKRVQERTNDLITANEHLKAEICVRKNVEEALRSANEFLEKVMRNVTNGIFVIDSSGKFTLVNPRVCEILAYSEENLIGNSYSVIISHAKMPQINELFNKIMSYGTYISQYETQIIRGDFTKRTVSLSAAPIYKSSKIVSIVCTMEDITARKEVQRKLKESEERFRIMADNAPVLIWMSDTNGMCNFVNKSWLDFTGRTMKQEKENGWIQSIHPKDSANVLECFIESFSKRQSYTSEFRLLRSDAIYRWIAFKGVPRFTEDCTFAGYIASCFDITERKDAENQIKTSLTQKEDLLREIHHRVKNNLQVINSLLKLQCDYIKDKDLIEILNDSRNRIRSMSLIHEKLYRASDLNQIEFGDYVRSLVNDLLKSYCFSLGKIFVNIEVSRVSFNVDTAIPVGLIINELVSNCFKYAFPNNAKGEISIRMNKFNDDIYELIVSDNGCGIAEDIDFRNTESLGFQLVNGLVNSQLNGEICLNRSKGTEFTIIFSEINYKERI
ncbi:sensory transduction histidine kinase [Candidatus Magnetoovum chiemensis]|nr:sensory transduction histidine kinase [Candidatus Magnetoovum chiemensis]